jgi:hypothetical protein
MSATSYLNRRAHLLENEHLEVVVTSEGGHLAVIRDKSSNINPLWAPPWPSIEPSTYNETQMPEYGANAESQLLCGILGHNLCLDLFGGPSPQEADAGLTVHGEGSIATYNITVAGDTLTQSANLPTCGLRFQRSIRLPAGARQLDISETVENLSICDRPVAWTQHVTLGPPFLEKGVTRFESTATRSKVIESDFTGGHAHLVTGAEFDWPLAPCLDGSTEDLRRYTTRDKSGAFSTHLMNPARDEAWFAAFNPKLQLAIAYIWKQSDFPWMGLWEENYLRTGAPWNGRALTRGLEFGVSPFAESRRAMIDRGSLFGVPGYRWIPARQHVTVHYRAVLTPADSLDSLPLP